MVNNSAGLHPVACPVQDDGIAVFVSALFLLWARPVQGDGPLAQVPRLGGMSVGLEVGCHPGERPRRGDSPGLDIGGDFQHRLQNLIHLFEPPEAHVGEGFHRQVPDIVGCPLVGGLRRREFLFVLPEEVVWQGQAILNVGRIDPFDGGDRFTEVTSLPKPAVEVQGVRRRPADFCRRFQVVQLQASLAMAPGNRGVQRSTVVCR